MDVFSEKSRNNYVNMDQAYRFVIMKKVSLLKESQKVMGGYLSGIHQLIMNLSILALQQRI